MKVSVRLFASLRKYLPAGVSGDTVTLDLPEGSTVADVIAHLGIREEHARMIVSNDEQLDVGALVQEGQELRLFPPLAGGR